MVVVGSQGLSGTQHNVKLLSEMVRKEGYNQWESRCGRGGWRETTVDLNPVLPSTVTVAV